MIYAEKFLPLKGVSKRPLWDDVLKPFYALGCFSATIFGGELRDWVLLNKPGKDIDISISYQDYVSQLDWFNKHFCVSEKCELFMRKLLEDNSVPVQRRARVYTVLKPRFPEMLFGKNLSVDVVVQTRDAPANPATMSDFGLNRIIYGSLYSEVMVSPSFLEGRDQQAFVIVAVEGLGDLSRLLKRYAGWTQPYINADGILKEPKYAGYALAVHPRVRCKEPSFDFLCKAFNDF